MAILMILIPVMITAIIVVYMTVSTIKDPKSLLEEAPKEGEPKTFGARLGIMVLMMFGMLMCLCLPILILPGILIGVVFLCVK